VPPDQGFIKATAKLNQYAARANPQLPPHITVKFRVALKPASAEPVLTPQGAGEHKEPDMKKAFTLTPANAARRWTSSVSGWPASDLTVK